MEQTDIEKLNNFVEQNIVNSRNAKVFEKCVDQKTTFGPYDGKEYHSNTDCKDWLNWCMQYGMYPSIDTILGYKFLNQPDVKIVSKGMDGFYNDKYDEHYELYLSIELVFFDEEQQKYNENDWYGFKSYGQEYI